MRRQDRVVRFYHGVRHCWGWINTELQLGLLSIIGGETLLNKSTETRTSATPERVENEEALETRAVIGEPSKLVHDDINLLLANGIMASSIWGDRKYENKPSPNICECIQSLAASSLPVTRVSGWKRLLYVPD